MASFGFLLMALAITPAIAAAAVCAFLFYPAQRNKPGAALTAVASVAALGSLALVVLLVANFGADGISPLIIGLAAAGWALSLPIIRQALRRSSVSSG